MGDDAGGEFSLAKSADNDERLKFQLAKLKEVGTQIEKLKDVEPNSIGQSGLQDDIKNRLDDLQAMGVLSVTERNEIEAKVRGIVVEKSENLLSYKVGDKIVGPALW